MSRKEIGEHVKALKEAGNDREAAAAADALQEDISYDDDRAAIAIEVGAIPPLVALVTNGSNPRGQRAAAKALAVISLRTRIPAAIVAAGGIGALVTLLRNWSEDHLYLGHEAAQALNHLYQYDVGAVESAANRAAIVNAAAVDPLVALVTNGSTGDRGQAARELSNLALCDAIQEAIADAGAIPLLVTLVTNGAADEQKWAARALGNVGSLNEANQEEIVAAGAVYPLVKLMRDANGSLKDAAAEALENLDPVAITSQLTWQLQALQAENASLKRRLDRAIAPAQDSDGDKPPPQKRSRG